MNQGPPRNDMMSNNVNCKECGMIHPQVSGGCPAAKIQKSGDERKDHLVGDFLGKLREFLYKSEHYENQIKHIKTMFRIK